MSRERPSRRPAVGPQSVKVGLFVRVFLLAGMAVIGSLWALVRYYTHPHAPMVVPVAPSGNVDPTRDWPSDGGLIVAPELERAPR